MKHLKKDLSGVRSSGFTLLELLVVVAIIGLLTAIVTIALSSARSKGIDASIKSQMKSLQNQIEITYVGSSYNNLFTSNNSWAAADTKIQNFLTIIDKLSSTHTAGSTTSFWAAQVRLVNESSKYFCVDTTGKMSTSTTAMAAGATVCP